RVLPAVALHRLLHRRGALHGVDGAGEHGEDAVTHVLHLGAAVLLQLGAQQGEVAGPLGVAGLVTEAGEVLGAAHHVGEEHRHDLGVAGQLGAHRGHRSVAWSTCRSPVASWPKCCSMSRSSSTQPWKGVSGPSWPARSRPSGRPSVTWSMSTWNLT